MINVPPTELRGSPGAKEPPPEPRYLMMAAALMHQEGRLVEPAPKAKGTS